MVSSTTMRLLSRNGLLEPPGTGCGSEHEFAETIRSELQDLCNSAPGSFLANSALGLRPSVLSLARCPKDLRSGVLDRIKVAILSCDGRIQEVRMAVLQERRDIEGGIRLVCSILSRPLPSRYFVQILMEINSSISLKVIKAGSSAS